MKSEPTGRPIEGEEGELNVGMGVRDNILIIRFETPVAVMGLNLASAKKFAAMLDRHIQRLNGSMQ